ncbi:hypothetical protein [Pseudomonas gingeri]|nr:hypothetical protein [Pseudomonas gingeri]
MLAMNDNAAHLKDRAACIAMQSSVDRLLLQKACVHHGNAC